MRHTATIVATLLLFVALLLGSNTLYAQCDRLGKVDEIDANCGVFIKEESSGLIFLAVPNEFTENLETGKYIRFSGNSAVALNPGCVPSPTATPISLTCRADAPACEATFEYMPVSSSEHTIFFTANFDATAQQACSWDFGDASPLMTGKSLAHTFPGEGSYSVCLTVKNAFGCTTQICKTVVISSNENTACGYSAYMTTVGKKLFGKLAPNSNEFTKPILSAHWRDLTHNQLLGENTALVGVELPSFGTYYICVEYTTKDSAGNVACTAMDCQQVNVIDNVCVSTFTVDSSLNCQNINAPVCGCNGIQYENECKAMAAGILSWKSGPCTLNAVCLADLDVTQVDGDPETGYTVHFQNLAQGEYSGLQLDFGDGSAYENNIQWTQSPHTYPTGGIYRVNLTIWNNSGAVSSITKLVATDSYNLNPGNLPDMTDYVLPGDANGDKKANVYDLLNVGLGYGTVGVPRPNATSNWVPQFSPNWSQSVVSGVNYKHLDCNGDGKVNEFDADDIEPNYSAVDTLAVLPVPGLPQVRVQFTQDTFVVTANGGFIEMNADILVGSPAQPALDLYGLAFALRYPEFIEHNPEADYDDNSFFGFTNHILWLPKDIYDRRQFDMGFVRKNGAGASGYGRIATLALRADFIIIVDIVDRTSTRVIPFTIPVTGLEGIDAQGNPLLFSVPSEMDTLWIELPEVSNTNDIISLQDVAIAPNPASQTALLYTGNLTVQRIEAINSLGQTMHTIEPSGLRTTHVETGNWQNGFYTLRVYTDRGVVTKKLVVQH